MASRMGRSRIPRSVQNRFWAVWAAGEGVEAAALAAGVSQSTGVNWVRQRGGVKPHRHSSGNDLTLEDRIQIQTGIAAGHSNARIAATIGCHRSTVGRELTRNRRPGDIGAANQRRGYNAMKAQNRADTQRRRPKPRSRAEPGIAPLGPTAPGQAVEPRAVRPAVTTTAREGPADDDQPRGDLPSALRPRCRRTETGTEGHPAHRAGGTQAQTQRGSTRATPEHYHWTDPRRT